MREERGIAPVALAQHTFGHATGVRIAINLTRTRGA